jgi:hypothetical protein
MDDFASASMVRLLRRAMAAEGLAPAPPLPDAARVPLQDKQQLVVAIVRAGGLPLLLRLAQQVAHIAGEPLHQALLAARDPHDFLARWQRLERYVHSRHRVLAHGGDAHSLVLEHGASTGPAPMAAESLAVLGAWIGVASGIARAISPGIGLVVFLVGAFGFMFVIEKNKNSAAGVPLLLAFTFFMGLMLSRLVGAVLGLANGGIVGSGGMMPLQKYASGGKVSSASARADGIAQRGKTRGKIV